MSFKFDLSKLELKGDLQLYRRLLGYSVRYRWMFPIALIGMALNTAASTSAGALMKSIIDDEDTRGVIGLAEATVIPGHGAIANAVFNACGARVRALPITAEAVKANMKA